VFIGVNRAISAPSNNIHTKLKIWQKLYMYAKLIQMLTALFTMFYKIYAVAVCLLTHLSTQNMQILEVMNSIFPVFIFTEQ